ncbi:sugar transporter domain-containing protein [Ditylenchus destructor]|nr:sugar transporter domain-containing protein [Ditylenchus destructor]
MVEVSKLAPGGSTFRTVFYVSIFTFMTKFYRAFAMAYTNVAGDNFRKWINDSFAQRGVELSATMSLWMWSMEMNSLIIGDISGAIFAPLLTENFGRRATLLVANAGVGFASLIGALSISIGSPELFLLARIFGATMSSECPSAKLRGTCYFLSGTAFKAVMVVGMVLGMETVLGHNLLILVGIGAIPSFTCCFMVMLLKETPKFLLVSRRNKDAAVKSLIFYQGKQVDFEKIFAETLKEEEDSTKSSIPMSSAIKELFCQSYLRKAVAVGFCAMHLQVGIWPMTTKILTAQYSEHDAELYSSILFAVNFIAGIFGAVIIGRISRRKLMIGSSIVNVMSLASYAAFDRLAFYVWSEFSHACLASMFFYNVSFGIGVGSIAPFIIAELLPQLHRTAGQCVVYFAGLSISFMLSLIMVPAYETYGVWVFIPLFIIPSTVCIIYLIAYLPETRGREIHEIVEELKTICGVNLDGRLSQVSMK